MVFFSFEIHHNKNIKVRETCIERVAGGKYIKMLAVVLGGLEGDGDYMQYPPFFKYFFNEDVLLLL